MNIKPTMTSIALHKQPRFGNAALAAPWLIKAFDYGTLGASTVAQNKLFYGTCIGSRVLESRTENERRENLSRDPLGWYNWFMGSAVVQTLIAQRLPKDSRALLIRYNPFQEKLNPLKRIAMYFFNPSKLNLLATDKQLHQRSQQIARFIEKSSDPAVKLLKEPMAKLFEKTIQRRALMSFVGLAYTCIALGILINLFNIWLTKRFVHNDQNSGN